MYKFEKIFETDDKHALGPGMCLNDAGDVMYSVTNKTIGGLSIYFYSNGTSQRILEPSGPQLFELRTPFAINNLKHVSFRATAEPGVRGNYYLWNGKNIEPIFDDVLTWKPGYGGGGLSDNDELAVPATVPEFSAIFRASPKTKTVISQQATVLTGHNITATGDVVFSQFVPDDGINYYQELHVGDGATQQSIYKFPGTTLPASVFVNDEMQFAFKWYAPVKLAICLNKVMHDVITPGLRAEELFGFNRDNDLYILASDNTGKTGLYSANLEGHSRIFETGEILFRKKCGNPFANYEGRCLNNNGDLIFGVGTNLGTTMLIIAKKA